MFIFIYLFIRYMYTYACNFVDWMLHSPASIRNLHIRDIKANSILKHQKHQKNESKVCFFKQEVMLDLLGRIPVAITLSTIV